MCFLLLVSTVEVTDGPVFTSLGSNFQLKCVVSGNDSFKAWRNAAGISVLNRPRFQYTQSGNEHNLNIINVQAKDRGIWTCWSTKRKRDSVILNVVGEFVSDDSEIQSQRYTVRDTQLEIHSQRHTVKYIVSEIHSQRLRDTQSEIQSQRYRVKLEIQSTESCKVRKCIASWTGILFNFTF